MPPPSPLRLLSQPFSGTRGRRLLRIAHALRVQAAAQAHGRCLATTLDFCLAAREQGWAVNVVVWAVADDPQFLDHWAAVVGRDLVIDLTRAQVDGRDSLTYALSDYPANYLRPRIYPAALFLAAYEIHQQGQARQLPMQLLWQLRWLMLGHDLGLDSGPRDSKRIAHAAVSLLKLTAVCALRQLKAGLQARREELLRRAGGPPARYKPNSLKPG